MQLGDTVSEIAADHGVPDWRTVWDANKGRAEPGGKRFTDPDHIEVGWTLTVARRQQGRSRPARTRAGCLGSPRPSGWPRRCHPCRDDAGRAAAANSTSPGICGWCRARCRGRLHPSAQPAGAARQPHRSRRRQSDPGPIRRCSRTSTPPPASPAQPGADHAGADSSAGVDGASSVAEDRSLATVAGYVAGGRSWGPGCWPRWSW